jgi:hypothetical protein
MAPLSADLRGKRSNGAAHAGTSNLKCAAQHHGAGPVQLQHGARADTSRLPPAPTKSASLLIAKATCPPTNSGARAGFVSLPGCQGGRRDSVLSGPCQAAGALRLQASCNSRPDGLPPQPHAPIQRIKYASAWTGRGGVGGRARDAGRFCLFGCHSTLHKSSLPGCLEYVHYKRKAPKPRAEVTDGSIPRCLGMPSSGMHALSCYAGNARVCPAGHAGCCSGAGVRIKACGGTAPA